MAGKEKKSFVLRIDPETFAALEKWAADDYRSLNGQIEYLLNEELKRVRRKPSDSSSKAVVGEDDKIRQ
jgi:Uncharacterized protein conserved in bacteria